MKRLRLWIPIALAGISLALPTAVRSQPDGNVALKYQVMGDAKLKDPIPGLPESGEAEFLTSMVNFTALLPFLPSWTLVDGEPRTVFTVDFLVQRRFLEETLVTQESDNLNNLGVRFGLIWRPSPRWSTIWLAGTRLAVDDLEKAQPRDLRYQLAALGLHQPRDNFEWGLGVLFGQFTGTSLVLPLARVDWRSVSGKWQFELLELNRFQPIVPRAALWYHGTPDEATWSLGLSVELTGQGYSMTQIDGVRLDDEGNIVQSGLETSLALSTLLIGPEIRVHTGTLEIAFFGGWATARRFEFRLPELDEPLRIPGENGTPVDADFKLQDVGFFMVNGAYRF